MGSTPAQPMGKKSLSRSVSDTMRLRTLSRVAKPDRLIGQRRLPSV